MTASNVRYPNSGAQLPFDPVKCGYPILVNISLITGAKEPIYPAKKAVVMPSPRQTRAGPKTGVDRIVSPPAFMDVLQPSILKMNHSFSQLP